MTRRRAALGAVGALAALVVVAPTLPAGAAGDAASKPAPVRITLKSDVTGRVISDRAACVERRVVHFLGHTSSGVLTSYGEVQTDDDGRFPGSGTRAARADEFGLVLGDARCRIAQSTGVDAPVVRRAPAAARRVSLKATPTSLGGRVTSKVKGCVKKVDVVLFVKSGPGEFIAALAVRTDRRGHYGVEAERARLGAQTKILAVAIGDADCRVAQSPTRTVSPPT